MRDQYKEDAERSLAGNSVERNLRRGDRNFSNRNSDTLAPGLERPNKMFLMVR